MDRALGHSKLFIEKKLKLFLQRIIKKHTWNIRHLVDKSFVQVSQRTSVSYCRVSDFKFLLCFGTKYHKFQKSTIQLLINKNGPKLYEKKEYLPNYKTENNVEILFCCLYYCSYYLISIQCLLTFKRLIRPSTPFKNDSYQFRFLFTQIHCYIFLQYILCLRHIQVNLCQKLFFLQNMGRTCCVQKLF